MLRQIERRLAKLEAGRAPGSDVFDPTDPVTKARIDAIREQIRNGDGSACPPSKAKTLQELRCDLAERQERVGKGVGTGLQLVTDQCHIVMLKKYWIPEAAARGIVGSGTARGTPLSRRVNAST